MRPPAALSPLPRLPACLRVRDRHLSIEFADVAQRGVPAQQAQQGGGGGGGTRVVFVGNLPPGATEAKLREVLGSYGEVRGCEERTRVRTHSLTLANSRTPAPARCRPD